MLLPGNLGFWHLPAKQRLYRATNILETMLMPLWLQGFGASFIGMRRRTVRDSGHRALKMSRRCLVASCIHNAACPAVRLLQLPFFFFIASHVEAVFGGSCSLKPLCRGAFHRLCSSPFG